jgi:hypothetical protein
MLITSANSSITSYAGGSRGATSSQAFQPAGPQDIVSIGNHADQQERFINLDPVVKMVGAGMGGAAGLVGGTVAYAFGAPGWVIAASAVGGGIIGAIAISKA